MDRYKGLLVKQRDIMTGLTGRLNERDEQILRLQEELEAYDSHQKCATPLPPSLHLGFCSHASLPRQRRTHYLSTSLDIGQNLGSPLSLDISQLH